MRRRFQPFDARLKVGERVFQCSDATIELCVRKLDHSLRLGESAIELLIETIDFTIDLLFELCDGLSNKANLVLNGFGRDVEVTAIVVRQSLRSLVEVPARLRVFGVKQPFQLVIGHEFILHEGSEVSCLRDACGPCPAITQKT